MSSQERLNAQAKEIGQTGKIINEVSENLPLEELKHGLTEEEYERFLQKNGLDDGTYGHEGRHFPDFDEPYSEWEAERNAAKRKPEQQVEEVSDEKPVEWKKAA